VRVCLKLLLKNKNEKKIKKRRGVVSGLLATAAAPVVV